jgi:exodeoxyribonuclease V alpha subunit
MIRGVGPVYAKKLVRAFGEKVFDVIEATPDDRRMDRGIPKRPADSSIAGGAGLIAAAEVAVADSRYDDCPGQLR